MTHPNRFYATNFHDDGTQLFLSWLPGVEPRLMVGFTADHEPDGRGALVPAETATALADYLTKPATAAAEWFEALKIDVGGGLTLWANQTNRGDPYIEGISLSLCGHWSEPPFSVFLDRHAAAEITQFPTRASRT